MAWQAGTMGSRIIQMWNITPQRSTESGPESRPEGGGKEVDDEGGTHGEAERAKVEEQDNLTKAGVD